MIDPEIPITIRYTFSTFLPPPTDYANSIKNANQDFEVTFNFFARKNVYLSNCLFVLPGQGCSLYLPIQVIYLFINMHVWVCVCGGGVGGFKCGHSSKSFAIFH